MFKKYVHALQLLNEYEVVSNNQNSTQLELGAAFDKLFSYIHANFEPPKSDERNLSCTQEEKDHEIALANEFVFYSKSPDFWANVKAIPPIIPEVIWPAAVGRYAAQSGMMLDRTFSKEWPEFYQRHKVVTLSMK